MMPRYIDAEALMQKLCKQCGVKDREYFCHAHCGDRMNIENMPTADVQPVRYGKWVKSNTQKHVEVTYECSECQHEVVGEYEKTPFCGGCGARMGGDSE